MSLIQCSIEWLAADRNRQSAEKFIAQCEGSDLVVLPEMFTTGFCTVPLCGAESGEPTLKWMQQMAERYNVTLAGSVAVEIVGLYYNRMYFVRPDGSYEKYDKHHLFSFAGEHNHYRAGQERVIVELKGVRILLLICYDIRFPVWCRNRGDYDMILCVANWAKPRRMPWDTLLRARAIENLSYVCGVNIVGDDPTSYYTGGTAAINYKGDTIVMVEDEKEGIATFDLDMEALEAFRERFPVLNDADKFRL